MKGDGNMARKLDIENFGNVQKTVSADSPEINLADIIDKYYEANKIKKEQDGIVKANSEIIKAQLKAKGLTEFNSGNHTAKISSSESVEYDEIILLKLAKNLPSELSSQIVETVEVVNLEKLERLIIEGKLETKQFKDAEVKKITTKLFVK